MSWPATTPKKTIIEHTHGLPTTRSAQASMTTPGSKRTRLQKLRRQTRLMPRQFWLLAGGTFFYLAVTGLAFPYTANLIHDRLRVSMGVVGLIMGGTALIGLPLQLVAGSISDRFGRRAVMLICAASEALMYGGLAFANHLWLVFLLVFFDRALGWPMYLTASNAMVADLVTPRLRAEGYSLIRLMIGAGTVVGPLVSALLLTARFAVADLFVLAGTGCLIYLGFTVLVLHETRPARPRRQRSKSLTGGATQAFGSFVWAGLTRPARPRRRGKGTTNTGYRQVLRDRRFLAFCLISLLPLYCFGQLYSSLPLLVTGILHIGPATWGLLMSLSSLVIVVAQYPIVRLAKRFDAMIGVAAASLLFGLGVGLIAFVPAGWPLFAAIVLFSLAQALYAPLSSTIVADTASVDLRGRYMGSWTLIWTAGQASFGPMLGGVLLDGLGAHLSYGMIIAFGALGASLYPLLRVSRRSAEPVESS
jgi:MFS family permease